MSEELLIDLLKTDAESLEVVFKLKRVTEEKVRLGHYSQQVANDLLVETVKNLAECSLKPEDKVKANKLALELLDRAEKRLGL